MAQHTTTSESKTVLLIGGTGNVGQQIAPQLVEAGFTPIITSRSGRTLNSYTSVKFDWDDESTWQNALVGGGSGPVKSVFIVAPGYTSPGEMARKFITQARGNGTRRFVLLSSSQFWEDSPALGEVHKVLREMGDKEEVEWAVMRPTWFQRKFLALCDFLKMC